MLKLCRQKLEHATEATEVCFVVTWLQTIKNREYHLSSQIVCNVYFFEYIW